MTTRPLTLGIDPGGRWTGLALLEGRDLIRADVVTRPAVNKITDLGYGLDAWTGDVLTAITVLAATVDPAAIAGGRVTLAVEGIVTANPHHRTAGDIGGPSSAGILATAVVLGAILGEWPGLVTIVPPAGHGSHPADGYPPSIRPQSAARRDIARHARSAYDVAIAAAFLRRLAAAERAAVDAVPFTVTTYR